MKVPARDPEGCSNAPTSAQPQQCAGARVACPQQPSVVMLFAFPHQSTTGGRRCLLTRRKVKRNSYIANNPAERAAERKCVEIFKSDEFLCTWQQQRHRG